jgi:hypothetical protein
VHDHVLPRGLFEFGLQPPDGRGQLDASLFHLGQFIYDPAAGFYLTSRIFIH